MDEADIGNRYMELERASLEASQRAKASPQQVRNPDGSWPTPECVECDQPIGEARLKLGFVVCIECALIAERRGQRHV